MKKRLNIYIVNSFTTKVGEGNPAGVVLLNSEIPNHIMQNIAKDIGKSETAFILNKRGEYTIRWFTPVKEMPICGHATLAGVKVLNSIDGCRKYKLNYEGGVIESNIDDNEDISMLFPIDNYKNVSIENEVLMFLGIDNAEEFIYGVNTGKLVVIVNDNFNLASLNPNFYLMKKYIGKYSNGIGVSKRSKIYDCETRYFNPWAGVDEDFVTGSVHLLLYSYWSKKLNKKSIIAKQNSDRPGILILNEANNDIVEIKGKASIIIKGQFDYNE